MLESQNAESHGISAGADSQKEILVSRGDFGGFQGSRAGSLLGVSDQAAFAESPKSVRETNFQSVCVIPARGGSKRIPRKNMRDFCGRPIIKYSIENAKNSGIFDLIIVSSDSAEILEFAKSCGVCALKRPVELSNDYAGTREVIIHAILSLRAQAKQSIMQNQQSALDCNDSLRVSRNDGARDSIESQMWVCCLYATAPLLNVESLREAFALAQEQGQDCYSFGAVEYDYSPFRAFVIPLDSTNCAQNAESQNAPKNKMLFKEHFSKRSQDLQKVFHDAGQFYFARAEVWQNRSNIFEDSLSYILPPSRVQDIDTLEDWALAELKFRALKT